MNVGADHQAWTTASLGVHPVPRGVGGWWASCISCPSSGLQTLEGGPRGGRQGGRLPLQLHQNVVQGRLLPGACTDSGNRRCHCTCKYPLFLPEAWILLPPQQFCLPTNMAFLPLISENEGSPSPEQETNVGTGENSDIDSHSCQPACHCQGGHSPWAAGVPNLDATIIMGATTSSSGEPGTSTGGITPQGPRLWYCHLARSPLTFYTPGSSRWLPYSQWLGPSI